MPRIHISAIEMHPAQQQVEGSPGPGKRSQGQVLSFAPSQTICRHGKTSSY